MEVGGNGDPSRENQRDTVAVTVIVAAAQMVALSLFWDLVLCGCVCRGAG